MEINVERVKGMREQMEVYRNVQVGRVFACNPMMLYCFRQNLLDDETPSVNARTQRVQENVIE